jgi:hypothetical protein
MNCNPQGYQPIPGAVLTAPYLQVPQSVLNAVSAQVINDAAGSASNITEAAMDSPYVNPAIAVLPGSSYPTLPLPTTQTMPQIVQQAQNNIRANGGTLPDTSLFSPQSLLRPLPQIVPTPIGDIPPACNSFAGWVSANPMLAVGVLAIGYFLLSGKKGGQS